MKPPVQILLVEDNEGDIELTKVAFEEIGLACTISVTHNGAEALDYLFNRGAFRTAIMPDFIMLDLNMPRMGGKEFLDIIKQEPQLKIIPVIVLTSSNASRDILESYERHANCYIIKPPNMEKFMDLAKQVEKFWTDLVQLPGGAVAL